MVRAALESVPDDEHARRLRAIEEALMVLARRLLNRLQEQRGLYSEGGRFRVVGIAVRRSDYAATWGGGSSYVAW